jgi:hypothetical protein
MGLKFSEGVGAAIEQRCGGPRRHTPNSQAILAAGLRLYRAAIVACFVLFGENLAAVAFGTFATLSAPNGHAAVVAACPLLRDERT